MRVILRHDDSGVSEVIGTILILAMTVVLFASIIIWVTSIPTPVAGTRLEIDAAFSPIYDGAGNEAGANITLRHQGGESLPFGSTAIYLSVRDPGGTLTTASLRLRGTAPAGPYGLIDGPDSSWNAGERWTLTNYTILPSTYTVSMIIVDTVRSTVVWDATLSPPAGSRPPLFVEKWADSIPETEPIDAVETGAEFWILAQVSDPDGDLNRGSVFAILTVFYGTGDSCALPQQMYDDGTHGDRVPFDSVFTLSRTCMRSPTLDWDGAIVLFNATDLQGHATSSRMTLDVIPGPPGSEGGDNTTGGSGRPQNLRWNGRQGYNIFNSSQWDRFKYTAKSTRTFRGSEEVIVVVGSLDLENSFDTNRFTLYDPYSGYPPSAVVYGNDKAVTQTSQPSSTQAFSFLEFVNGYYVYRYRFKLNDVSSVGVNFERVPAHPPDYYFARYTFDILMTAASGTRFNTTDSINVTDEDGYIRDFPQVHTFSDSSFTQETQTFGSTDIVYVQVQMFTVDPVVDPGVQFGNIRIKDYLGGTQLWRTPANGNDVNSPICSVAGKCVATGTGDDAVSRDGTLRVYRFSINLTRADQDPWVEGAQNYALTVTSVRDSDETYAEVSTQLAIVAPLYKLDVAIGNEDTTSSAWGTHDYSYYYENVNGFDRWRKERVEYCGLGGTACSSLEKTVAVAFLDFDRDGDLDITGSVFIDNNDARMYVYRRDLDFTGNVIFTRFLLEDQANVYCQALATGDVTGDGASEIVCGATNGHVWYYRNDGSWHDGLATKVSVDTTRAQSVNAVQVADFNGDGANDIAVGGDSGRLTWYPNLDGLGKFQNIGIVDDWFADGENTRKGNITAGSYLSTYVSDDAYEQIREAIVTEPVQSGGTTNPSYDVDNAGWTYLDWLVPASADGARQAAGGNPNGYLSVTTNFVASTLVAGYWYQAFTVAGSPPFTATLNLDWRVVTFGATGGSVTLYAFVDTASGVPTVGQQVWSSGAQSATTSWASVTSVDVSSKIATPGTYYLKIAVRTQNAGSGSSTVGGFDNVALSWTSTGGQVSELEHYWRLTQLPTRPGTTFTFNLEARHSANAEGDNFEVAYSTNVVGSNPLTGTYTTFLWVNATGADQPYSYILSSTVAGKVLWIRVLDMGRVVGDTALDTLFVDRMYVRADTPAGTTGASLTNPGGDTSDVKAIDADDQDGDGYQDLVVGTANGKVYKYLGSGGGLMTPVGAFWSHPAPSRAIVGVKLAQVSGTQTGLEVVVATDVGVHLLTGSGSTGTRIRYTGDGVWLWPNPTTILSFDVGDVNGDGWDDVVVGTGATNIGKIEFWENTNHGLAWTTPVTLDDLGKRVYAIDLGDASKSQYLGR